MKRLGVVCAFVLSMVLPAWGAYAASPSSGSVGAPPGQLATELRIANTSAFSPATITSEFTATNSNNGVTDTGTYPRAIHSQNYDTWGRVTGYSQVASWTPAGSTSAVGFVYAGSVFGTAQGAQSAWKDGSNYYPSKYTGISFATCPSGINVSCTRWLARFNDNTSGYYDFVQYNQCLAETRGVAPTAIFNAQQNQISQTLDNIDRAALVVMKTACSGTTQTTPTPVSTQVDFSIISVRIEKNNAKPDWNQVRPPIRQIKVKKTVYLSVYWVLKSAPANPSVTYTLIVKRNGSLVFQKDYPDNFAYTSQTWRKFFTYTPPRKGTYQLTARITVNGVGPKQSSTQWQVLGNTPPPPPPSPFTFSFDRLLTTDAGGHDRTQFALGQTVRSIAVYTVRNLPAGRVMNGEISFQFQTRLNGTGPFRTGGGATDPLAVARNGTFRIVHVTTNGFQQATTVRILVGISFNGRTLQQHRDVQVR